MPKENKSASKQDSSVPEDPRQKEFLDSLPKEARQKLEDIKKKLELLKTEVLKKFDKYIVGVSLLPPQQSQAPPPNAEPGANAPQVPPPDNEKINVLILIDDSDSQSMSKVELKTKLTQIIEKAAQDIDPNLNPMTVILSELWQNCFDGKFEMLQTIALGAPIYDTGMLSAIKIAEIHKTMVIKKFEKYIVSYVLASSLISGTALKRQILSFSHC